MTRVVLRTSGLNVDELTVDGRNVIEGNTRIAIDCGVHEVPRLSLDYIAMDINAELGYADVVSHVHIAGINGEGPTVRDAVADVLRQMDEA
jgi:hypothetical protein